MFKIFKGVNKKIHRENYLPPTQLLYGIKGVGVAKALSLELNGNPGNFCPKVNATFEKYDPAPPR